MAEEVHAVAETTFGSKELFSITLALAPASAERDVGLAWGKGMLWLAGEPLWCWEDAAGLKPIEWTWIDLLEFLADSWIRLIVEESYPFRLTPTNPTKLRMSAERRWEKLSNERALDEDEALCRFECHHDLARGMRGIDLPSVFLMREGAFLWVCSEAHPLRLSCRHTIDVLADCGDYLAAHIAHSANPRARDVSEKWANRLDMDPAQVLGYRLGIKPATVMALEGHLRRHSNSNGSSAALWELPANDPFADTELQAAARMTGSVGNLEQQGALLARMKAVPRLATPELDSLTNESMARVDSSMEPYAQGYDAARWLRAKLGAPSGRVEPQQILNRWNVQVIDFAMPSIRLDAVACWGPRHGPAVLLNQQGEHAQHELGARSTLAHEIAHLLLDRNGSLPLAEVLGGNAPEMPEKRARAFAAEFLLPQEVVMRTLEGSQPISDAVKWLRDEYAVSKQIVGWQMRNSSAWSSLDDEVRSYVEDLTMDG